MRVAIVTSGGDAPGLNAAIRSAVRSGMGRAWEMFGVQNGYAGLVGGHFVPLDARAVGGIIQRGGTILGSRRWPEFKSKAVQCAAIEQLRRQGVDALVVVGGDGSQAGTRALCEEGFPAVGVPSTID